MNAIVRDDTLLWLDSLSITIIREAAYAIFVAFICSFREVGFYRLLCDGHKLYEITTWVAAFVYDRIEFVDGSSASRR
ncbi:hypothetical protein CCP3SC15_770005 [Gammaproteobacteria bacterium]